MSYPAPTYTDGWFGIEKEITVVPEPLFPFENSPTPDTYSRAYLRRYQVQPTIFLPKIDRRTSWTNLLTYSQAFSNIAWSQANVTPTVVTTPLAPDGNATLNKILETAVTDEHEVQQAATTTAAAHEMSVFAQSGLGRDWIQLVFIDSATTSFSAFFNVTSGYATRASAGVTAIITPLGNGQFQCAIRFTPAAGSGLWQMFISPDGTATNYAGNTAKGIYLWGAQIAAGSSAPYISTTSTTRTVSAPDRDKTDPLAYLLWEDKPNPQNSKAQVIGRIFGRVPNDQVSRTSRSINKPSPATYGTVDANFRNHDASVFYGAGYVYIGYAWSLGTNQVFGPQTGTTSSNSGSDTTLNWTAHGIGAGDTFAARGSSWFIFQPGQFTIVDANTITLIGVTLGNTVGSAGKLYRSYTPGLDRVGIQQTQRFYLPGVTVGVATANDIPLPNVLLNDVDFLAAVISTLTGLLDYDANQLEQYSIESGGPTNIYTQTFDKIDMATV